MWWLLIPAIAAAYYAFVEEHELPPAKIPVGLTPLPGGIIPTSFLPGLNVNVGDAIVVPMAVLNPSVLNELESTAIMPVTGDPGGKADFALMKVSKIEGDIITGEVFAFIIPDPKGLPSKVLTPDVTPHSPGMFRPPFQTTSISKHTIRFVLKPGQL